MSLPRASFHRLGSLLDVFFPRRCAGCGRGAWPFCGSCRERLVPLAPPWCERCGLPLPRPAARCRECPPAPVARARAAFAFEGPARAAVHRLKFSGWRGVAEALGDAMTAVAVSDDRPVAEIVTWVPLARARLAERGFDQARALAVVVARGLGLPAARLLSRAGDTGAQARRAGAERREAMRGRFVPAGAHVPARVLLVDDVLTTGATTVACAEALVRAGSREISVLTAARAFSSRGYTRAGSRAGLWLPGEEVPR